MLALLTKLAIIKISLRKNNVHYSAVKNICEIHILIDYWFDRVVKDNSGVHAVAHLRLLRLHLPQATSFLFIASVEIWNWNWLTSCRPKPLQLRSGKGAFCLHMLSCIIAFLPLPLCWTHTWDLFQERQLRDAIKGLQNYDTRSGFLFLFKRLVQIQPYINL